MSPADVTSTLTYLPHRDVVEAASHLDAVAVVRQALVDHADGNTLLPEEAYLGWTTGSGHHARSICLPGGVPTPTGGFAYGSKMINSSLGNAERGIPRAQGLMVLHDPDIGWPSVVMEAAFLSALRTAAVSAVGAAMLRQSAATVLAVVGTGALARAHLRLLDQLLPDATEIRLFDERPDAARALAESTPQTRASSTVAESAQACIEGADVILTTTTVTAGYIPHAWLAPGALIVHVSLDDVLPDVVQQADLIVVDDWNLVRSDTRRILGRMHDRGEVSGPDSPVGAAGPRVAATLADLIADRHPGRSSDSDVILLNPFGMGVLDVALGSAIADIASAQGAGMRLPR